MLLRDVDDYDWPNLMCNWCRKRKAELLHEDEPLCIPCADMTLERYLAVVLNPEMHNLLPPLRETR